MDKTAGNRSKWNNTLRLIRRAKLPWLHYVLSSIVPFVATFIYIYLPEIEGRIAAGEIFDASLVRKYIILSLLLVSLNILSYYSAWVSIQFDRKVQKLTWRRLILMPGPAFEKEEASSLITRITDDSGYLSQFIDYVFSVIMSVYSAVLMVLSLFRMSPVLASYTVPVIIFNAVFGLVMQGRGYDVGYSLQDAVSRYSAFLSERAYQMKLVKAMGTEADELALGSRLSDERRSAEMRAQWYEILISIVMELTNILVVGGVLIGGALLIQKGRMGTESLIAFYILAMTLPNTMQELLFQLIKMHQYRGAVEVISKLGAEEICEASGVKSLKPMEEGIEFKDVSFSYEDRNGGVLDNVSFAIPKGKTTAIIGATGSGKTTALKLIERFYAPKSGEILCDGTDIADFDLKDWRSRIGYIVQKSPLISGSIRSNIMYGAKRDLSDAELDEIMRCAGLEDMINSLPDGLDTHIEGNGENISGGQRQRIAIARALAAEPEILIMDEATSNLDPETARTVEDALREYTRDKTVIIVAHKKSALRGVDQIIEINKGDIK